MGTSKKPPRRAGKAGKRTSEHAAKAAIDIPIQILANAIALQNVAAARDPKGHRGAIRIIEIVAAHFDRLRSPEELRAAHSLAALADMQMHLQASHVQNTDAIVRGFGDQVRKYAVADSIRLAEACLPMEMSPVGGPIPMDDLVQGLDALARAELEPAHDPVAKPKRFRSAVAKRVGLSNERALRKFKAREPSHVDIEATEPRAIRPGRPR